MSLPLSLRRLSGSWAYLAIFAVALAAQLQPAWREALIYDRTSLAAGEWWRIWTGHAVHFGWPHFIADGGLLLIIGATIGREYPRDSLLGFILMPPVIAAVLYWFDPTMARYAGLSALNLGLLLLLAARSWTGEWRDWFWPAIVVIYVVELGYEIFKGGRGGGFIQFDDPGVKVATSAHLAAVAYALMSWVVIRMVGGRKDRNSIPPANGA